MKRFLIIIFVLATIVLACKTETETKVEKNKELAAKQTNENLKVMTYNIRLDVAVDGENAWPNRKNFLNSQVLFHAPDILGVQEARPNQMADLKSALKGYKSSGTGRDGENKGEFSALFYNTSKLKIEQENTFWLSETPTEISKGWDAAYPRICSYALFTVLNTNKKMWVVNTHLDHVGKEAQLNGMDLIQSKIAEINTNNYPVIIMGDFNVEPDSQLITNLTKTMNDSKAIASIKFGPNGTFNGFKYNEPVSRRIDYIMLSKNIIDVKKYGVLSSTIDFKFPSDHFPVLVELKLN
ncbi:MAG: endonuclease/exonuclease/phosphatase family protein [Lacinutrix venerupis]